MLREVFPYYNRLECLLKRVALSSNRHSFKTALKACQKNFHFFIKEKELDEFQVARYLENLEEISAKFVIHNALKGTTESLSPLRESERGIIES